MRNERTSETIQRIPWRLVLLCGGTLLLFGAAAPASADSNFSRGFERELGRILAHEAVNAGKAVLFHGVVHPHASHGYQNTGYGDYDDHRERDYRDRRHIQIRRHRAVRRHHGHSFKRYVRDDYYYDDDRRRHRKHKKRKHHKRKHYRNDGCDGHY